MISIIIPVLNEAAYIETLLDYLDNYVDSYLVQEILIVDGGSTDATPKLVKRPGYNYINGPRGRAKQMNLGASLAQGTILYFLHVDTIPPKNFDKIIVNSMSEKSEAGCFRMKFDSDNLVLKLFSWFTRINHQFCRGGDQSLYISKSLFTKCGGFNEDYIIYEDNEFISRLYKSTKFKVQSHHVMTSARKYEKIGTFKLQYYFGMIHLQKTMGAGPTQLYEYYQKKIQAKI